MLYVTKKEIEEPRPAAEIKRWATERIKLLTATEKGKDEVRFRVGNTKVLVEEMLPLGIFCEHYFKAFPDVIIQQVVGNQNYDAIILNNKEFELPFEYIEITQAHEGEGAYLRMLYSKENGHANLLGRVTKYGTKNTGITVEIENEAVEHSIVVKNGIQRVHDAAKRKYEKQYPLNTALIIICDDFIAFSKREDIDKLREYFQAHVVDYLSNFGMVFIVGWSSYLYLEFNRESNELHQPDQFTNRFASLHSV